MNPPTPGPLTVLLVPPEGDTALLADECGGGRVPTAWLHRDGRWLFRSEGGVLVDGPHALVLVHEGTPVAMGCDRLARSMNVLPYGAYTEAWAHTMGRAYAGEHPGARVVLLRDGWEVPSV